jgi:hypothetical protein
MFEWLALALAWDLSWLLFYISKPKLRRQMLWIRFFTMLIGFLQPIFVPRYWNPLSLFNLAATSHFYIESLLFSFGTGGMASILYNATLNAKRNKMKADQSIKEKRGLHLLSIAALPVVFSSLLITTGLNPIYCVARDCSWARWLQLRADQT